MGAANLQFSGASDTVFRIAPAVEVGSEWRPGSDWLARPFLRGGLALSTGADFNVEASYAGAPPFTVRTDINEVMGMFGAGLDIIGRNDSTLRRLRR